MIEAPRYPYEPGKYGFPLEALLFQGWSSPIQTESGNTLYLYQTDRMVSVQDISYTYRLIAEVDRQTNALQLNLQTKQPDARHLRHPDLFASKFVEVIVDYLRLRGFNPEQLLGEWKEGGDNYEQFWKEYKDKRNKVLSAKSTWTGKIAEKTGFPVVREEHIQIFPKEVHAHFRQTAL